MDYSIEALSLTATDVEAMAKFYAGVFEMELATHEIEGGVLHSGRLAGWDFVIVPQSLTGVDARQNRLQLDVFVSDLDELIRRVECHGGRTNGRLAEDDEVRCIGCFDPDDNFIVFKQRK